MTHHADTRSIEDGIAASRTRLAATLEELWDRVSVDSVAHDALGLIRSNAADYTGALDRAVRANPLALAVTGIGLAWLVFGSRRTTPEPAPDTGARREAEDGAARLGGRDEATGVTEDDNTWSHRLDALRDVARRFVVSSVTHAPAPRAPATTRPSRPASCPPSPPTCAMP